MPGRECGVNSLQRVFSGQAEDYITRQLQSVCVLLYARTEARSDIITLQDSNQTSGSDLNIACIIVIQFLFPPGWKNTFGVVNNQLARVVAVRATTITATSRSAARENLQLCCVVGQLGFCAAPEKQWHASHMTRLY